ncbi:DUF3606 domain-containing protein [Flavihumibacter sp. R14]|nr:DUF3606 domain-containing protein [Flavihumibacter soli]
MMDNKQNVGSQDRDRINVNQDHELKHWSEKYGVSHEELKQAVKAVGPMAKDVEEYLKKSKPLTNL